MFGCVRTGSTVCPCIPSKWPLYALCHAQITSTTAPWIAPWGASSKGMSPWRRQDDHQWTPSRLWRSSVVHSCTITTIIVYWMVADAACLARVFFSMTVVRWSKRGEAKRSEKKWCISAAVRKIFSISHNSYHSCSVTVINIFNINNYDQSIWKHMKASYFPCCNSVSIANTCP